jgi:hypothetical protein
MDRNLYIRTKLDLSQDCQDGIRYGNKSMQYTVLISLKTKIYMFISTDTKMHLTKF